MLPAAQTSAARLRLQVSGGGTALSIAGLDGVSNHVTNPQALSAHGAMRAVVEARNSALALPASVLFFTDGSGQDREVYLPAVTLAPGDVALLLDRRRRRRIRRRLGWRSAGRGRLLGTSQRAARSLGGAAARLPRRARRHRLSAPRQHRVPSDARADRPTILFFYVTELYGNVKVVSRSGTVSDYAANLLNFNPTGRFPRAPASRASRGSSLIPPPAMSSSRCLRLSAGEETPTIPRSSVSTASDGGRTMAAPDDHPAISRPSPWGLRTRSPASRSAPTASSTFTWATGSLTAPAQNLASFRGKILRINLDGSRRRRQSLLQRRRPAHAGIYVYRLRAAQSLRRRLARSRRRTLRGRERAQDGSPREGRRRAQLSLGRLRRQHAQLRDSHLVPLSTRRSIIAFMQLSTFGGSGFPPAQVRPRLRHRVRPHLRARASTMLGKRITEFVLDANGNFVSGPLPLVEYAGTGRGSAVALAAGPDGLYFTDLYKDFGAATPTERGRECLPRLLDGHGGLHRGRRIRGVPPDGSSSTTPLTSPGPPRGTGSSATAESPPASGIPCTSTPSGRFDVRLTVTGAGGETYRQKASFIAVAPSERLLEPGPPPRPTPRVLEPREVPGGGP